MTAEFAHVREAVRGLTEEQLALPTRLGAWTVRELVAHLAMAMGGVVRLLEEPAPVRQETTLLDWPFAPASMAPGTVEDTRALVNGQDAHDVPCGESISGAPQGSPTVEALLDQVAGQLTEALADAPDDRLLATRSGAMRLDDHLVTRCVELVVHSDDLAAATGLSIPHDRQALATATRLLADALARKAPGGSVEVRVPPYAVVQCVEGPKHTRGTPPNVVETDPLTWLRLATGRLVWAQAVADAAVSASGERADIGELLPVLG